MPSCAKKVCLSFREPQSLAHVDDPIRKDVSAIAALDRSIFVACDETASVERLVQGKDGNFGKHKHFPLGSFFDLPDGPAGEMDIEGLDVEGDYLWITGSHSLKRDKPERDDHGARAALDRMMEIDRDPNRYFLGCVPLKRRGDGKLDLVRKHKGRRAASIKLKKNKSQLFHWLKRDTHLKPFFDIPSKENGFDIEGIAAKGSRVWVGLRGPVLRGHGVIVEFDFKRKGDTRLKARRLDGKRRYRKHVLDTRGLGIRDLCFDGNDLLILLGTPLASDGPCHVMRWENAAFDTTSGVVDKSRTTLVLDLPYTKGEDHAEGMDLLDLGTGNRCRLLVVYDSPSAARVAYEPPRLYADEFNWP